MPTTGQSPSIWELVPDSTCTKKRQGPNGPSIHIPPGAKELLVGRGVEGEGCLPLWPQISTKHCRIYTTSEEPHLWYIQDTSTNGTCINGERVPKGISRHLKEGDRVKLAALTEDPEKIVQYIFTKATGSRTASPNKEAASRKRAFEESGPSNASHKRMSPAQAVAPVDAAILKKLRTSNDDLRMKLQKERQATQAAEAKAEEAEAKMREAQAAVAQSADAALAQAKAELVAVKGEVSLQAAALCAAQQEVETYKGDLKAANSKLEGLQIQVQQLQADRDELRKKMKKIEGDLLQLQKDRQRVEDAQRHAEEQAQAALEAKQAAEQACIGAHSLQQEAERNLRTTSQKLQEAEDARSAAEEKAACLEALLQQYAAKLTEVREAEAEQEAAAENMAATFQEALGQLAAKRGQQGTLLVALQRQLAAALADTSPNPRDNLQANQASPKRSHGQTNGAPQEYAGVQQASPARSQRLISGALAKVAGTQKEQAQRLKGSSSEATHAQRSSCRSATSGQAESAHEAAGASDRATLPVLEPEHNLDDVETQRASPAEEGNEEPTAAQWQTKLPQIAEASSAECRGDNSPSMQHVSLVKLAFKDGQGTLGTPSLFPGSNGQPHLPSLVHNSTAAGSQERLHAGHAQPGSLGASAGHKTAHEDDEMADGSPTADRENVPDNHPAGPRLHSQGKGSQAAGDAGSSLKLSLQSAGGQGGAVRHGEEWDEME